MVPASGAKLSNVLLVWLQEFDSLLTRGVFYPSTPPGAMPRWMLIGHFRQPTADLAGSASQALGLTRCY